MCKKYVVRSSYIQIPIQKFENPRCIIYFLPTVNSNHSISDTINFLQLEREKTYLT